MARPCGFGTCLAFALLLAPAGVAGEAAAGIATDANIVTGLDISDSVPAAEMRRQIAGMAAAIRSPEVLAAIRRGRERRIGFAVFAWHHHRYTIVPWTLVASAADAAAVARAIEERIPVNVDAEVRRQDRFWVGRMTDLSRAIDHAGELLATAPFGSERGVVNIVGNGADNVGEAAGDARDRVLAAGASLNGVVTDGALLDYYRRQVMGGSGAFVMVADGGGGMGELMRRKFLQDLIAAGSDAGGATVARN